MAKRARHLRGEEHLLHKRLTAPVIAGLLSELHDSREWVFGTEVRNATGWASNERYFDAFALNCWPSKGFHRIAYEIKVSRSDFLHELKQHEKRVEAMKVCHEFYFVTSPDVAAADEVPENCGLYHATDTVHGWQLKKVKVAMHREIDEVPSMAFVASLCRNIADTSMAGMQVFRIGERKLSATEVLGVLIEGADSFRGREKGALAKAVMAWQDANREKLSKALGAELEVFKEMVREATGYKGPLRYPYQVAGAIDAVKGVDKVPERMMTAVRGAAHLLETTAAKLRAFIDNADGGQNG